MSGSDEALTNRLRGTRILVVEDEFLIATVVEDILKEAGAREVVIAMGAGEAREVLSDAGAIDAAVIDIQLNEGDESGLALAEVAFKQSIPFVFLTGYNADLVLPDLFFTVPLVTKPYTPDALVAALSEVMRMRPIL
jgi:CheY-like chemotaxis protein